jgi:uncharacterized protein
MNDQTSILRASHHPVQEIDAFTDSREILANGQHTTDHFNLNDNLIVDIDAHHIELDSWV